MYRLLIADDERIERDALRFTVQKASADIDEVCDASNGDEAVSKAIEFRPDICFLDIKMPGSSGIEAAREIKRRLPAVRIVFLTAFDYFDYAREAIRIGVDDYIIKPASEANVVEVIRRIAADLDHERSEREHSKRVARKLDLVSTALETEITEGIARGFVATEKLVEFAALREFHYATIATATTTVDLDSYPMKVADDSHKEILNRRCLRLMQRLLRDEGILAVFAPAADGFDFICYVPAHFNPDALFASVSREIQRRLALVTSTIVSSRSGDAGSVAGLPRSTDSEPRRGQLAMSSPSGTATVERGASCFPPPVLEGRLLAAITGGDRVAAQTATDDIFAWLSARTAEMSEVCRIAADFLVVVRHSLARRYPRASFEAANLTRILDKASGPQEVRAAMRDQAIGYMAAITAGGNQSAPLVVRRVEEYIEHHFSEWISLAGLAEEVRQSTYHVSRLFKQHTGSSIVEYLNSVRIDRAKFLFRKGDLTVKEVSLRVGFTDPNYFARVFRRFEGVSPSVYRNRLAG